jgi:predicted RNase H-like HicB family nuclease
MKKYQITALIEKEKDLYVSLCPELDIASQGKTIEEACSNLQEAVELFFESASDDELRTRLQKKVFITQLEISVG